MDRREFIALSTVGVSAPLVSATNVFAATDTKSRVEKAKEYEASSMAGGVYYTADNPGRWEKKAAGHVPQVTINRGEKGTVLTVTTPHEMKSFDHYIVKHIVLDKDFNFMSEKMFNPAQEPMPVSNHVVGDYKGEVYVISVCNEHDSWMKSASVL